MIDTDKVKQILVWSEEAQKKNYFTLKEHVDNGEIYRVADDMSNITKTGGKIDICQIILDKCKVEDVIQ